ncbi:hypothetical protein [Ideonella paludis]|uniref:hypothetical protein n=1 Tax=Ideonella paludis TaxID=1233411 RepID=UPI003629F267
MAPATSPTLYSTYGITAGDQIQWTTYLQSKIDRPYEAIGTVTLPPNFSWVKGSVVVPPKVSMEWKVSNAWTATEPSTGTLVGQVRWKQTPLMVVNFGVVDSTVDFTGTGDGFRIIPYKDRLFVVNHHSTSGYLNCRMAKTGGLCPGFPSNGAGLSFSASNGAVLTTNSTYRTSHAPLEAMNLATGELFVAIHKYGTNEVKVLCTNVSTSGTPTSCGEFHLGFGTPNPEENVANLAYFAQSGRYYSWLSSGQLVCFNVKTKTSCGSKTLPLDSWSPNRGMVHVAATQFEDKFFFATPVRTRCFDAVTNNTCAGWPDNGFASATGVYPYLSVDANGLGRPKGVCDSRGNYCRDLAGNSFTASANFRSFINANAFVSRDNPNWGPDGYVRATWSGAYVGTRIYTSASNWSTGGVSCFDFKTDRACPTYSPSTITLGYTTYVDPTRPNCILHLGDNSRGLLFDATTNGPCTDGTGADQPKLMDVTPADYYRCDATKSRVTGWDQVRLSHSLPWGTGAVWPR